jgi:hypothetical protein
MTAFGACSEPVRAGLAPRFQIVKHPDAGRGCPAFRPHQTALEARAERLLKSGAIGLDDLDHVRMLVRTQRAGDAAELLDLIEQAEGRR